MRLAGMIAATLMLTAALHAQSVLPPGTILPVSLEHGIKANKAQPGQRIEARVMQDIPDTPVHRGARVVGHVVHASSAKNGQAMLEIRFDAVQQHGQQIPMEADLRAVASFVAVGQAEVPEEMSSRGLTPETWTTQQIGGDQVYRGGGPVAVGMTAVGKPTPYGAVGQPLAQAGQPCRGSIDGNTHEQAFWLFSTSACGVYGLSNIHIEHAGRSDPAGTIVLTANSRKLALAGGSALLLRVQGS
jgi:hypothetical protein